MESGKPIEILLVEDDADDLELSLRTLRKHGLANHVRVARDGAVALDIVADSGTPGLGLVLLDSKLPKRDGIEVLREIRSGATSRRLPVVMMVSSDQEREYLERQGAATDGYVVKPVAFETLSRVVHAIGLVCPLCRRTGANLEALPASVA
jgi:two-component system response regulator